MYILKIFVFLVGVNSNTGGGSESLPIEVPFNSRAECNAAKNHMVAQYGPEVRLSCVRK